MNSLALLQLIQMLGGLVPPSTPPSTAVVSAPTPSAPPPDLASLAALVSAMQPAPPAEVKLPRSAAFVAAIVVSGFFLVLAAIAGLLMFGPDKFGAALAVLCVGFGVLAGKFSTIVDYLFGSCLGSGTNQSQSPQPPIITLPSIPLPSLPSLPAPSPSPVPDNPTPTAPTTPAPAPAPTTPAPIGNVDGIGRSTNPSTAGLRSDVAPNGQPASVRYCNPGAQYPSDAAAAFGQMGYGMIGGAHKIALFPHPVNGAASNFDLLSRSYTGMTVAAAGDKWTGSNGHGIPGYDDNMILTKAMIADPAKAIPIMQAIAEREAGKPGTLTDQQWSQAHAMFLAGSADAWLGGRGGSTVPTTSSPASDVIYATWATDLDADKVKAIQSALQARGFSPGDIDGEYGDNTASAVSAFQQASNLTVDGEVGPETAKALGVDLTAKSPPTTPTQPTPGAFPGAPPWFTWAMHEVGTKEDPDNTGPAVQRYIDLAHAGAQHDPWCAIFANAALEANGIKGTRSASSQSFRSSPDFVELAGPALGALAVFWRGSESSGLGHVGFYRGEAGSRLWILGGNEGDMVQVEAFPRSSSSFGLIGYWWPASVPLPKIGAVLMPSGTASSIKSEGDVPKVT